jgi:putative flippase GtrA
LKPGRVKALDPSLYRARLRKPCGVTLSGSWCRTLSDVAKARVRQDPPFPDISGVTDDSQVEPVRGIRGLVARFEHIVRELGKFGVVGSVSFVVDTLIFNVLLYVHIASLLAATISMTIAASVAFVGNRFWTWRDRERTGLHREYLLYFLFNLVGLGIALGCLAIGIYGLGAMWPAFKGAIAQNIAKNVVGTALGTAFRFWAYRQIVFRR